MWLRARITEGLHVSEPDAGRKGAVYGPCSLSSSLVVRPSHALVLAAALACFAAPLHAAPDERRAALVVGNSAYQDLTLLPNAVNDARRVGEVLTKANFEVVVGENLGKAELEKAVRDFLRSLNDGDVALFYYSGHAVQVAGENFILPVDANLSSSYDLELESYNISNLLDYMRESSSLQILVLDACRDNPFLNEHYHLGDQRVAVESTQGLASLVPRQGSLIVYSTAPNQVAYDGAGDLSPFSESLADNVLTPNVEVRHLLTDIRADVIRRTNGRQVPWDVSSLTSPFYFVARQNMLVMSEALTEIRASPESREVRLDIPPPIASGDLVLTASFDQAPRFGALMLDGKPVEAGEEIAIERLSDLVYVPEPGEKSVELLPYSIVSDGGERATGAVALVFDATRPPEVPATAVAESAPPPEPEPASPAQLAEAAPEPATMAPAEAEPVRPVGTAERVAPVTPAAEREPVQLALAASVGTGFVALSDATPAHIPVPEGWYRVEERSPQTQIALDTRILSEGDLVRSDDVGRLAVRPALQIAGAEARIVLQPATSAIRNAPVVINVDASVHRCDELAADLLDIQGVVEGIFPNDLRLGEAEAACREAVGLFPDVARFKYQLGRVLFGQGAFDEAVENLQAAQEGGHVRAGYLLGRLYQLGGPLGRDPARAVSLFEAGAQRGDPYAQHALGRALVEGAGTEQDIQRGAELLTRAAEAGHTFAMNALGTEYLNGNRLTQDAERALRFFRASAERTDVYGLLNMGVLYRDGVGVEANQARARQLFDQAHAGGHPRAGTLIALLLRSQGTADPAELLGWFRQSAGRGDAWGAFHAANILSQVPSLQEEDGEAIRLFALAASHGTPEVSELAERAVSSADGRSIAREVQRALARMGADVGAIDGVLGPRSREAATSILGARAPGEAPGLLIELLRKEWLDSRPRLDMLG